MPQTQEAPAVTGTQDWRAEYAYTAGVQAFIYGFPYIHNAKLRHDWVTQARDTAVIPYAAVNQFWHAARLIDAMYRDGGCPNNDALYSLAWLDLRDEPVILSHPDMADRYFSFELTGFTSDNFGYVGQRTTGPGAGHFAITGPGWQGDLPAKVQPVGPAPTPWVLVLGRTLVDGTSDPPNVRALQPRYRLTPLSLWDKPEAAVPERREVYAPYTELTVNRTTDWVFKQGQEVHELVAPSGAVYVMQSMSRHVDPNLEIEQLPTLGQHLKLPQGWQYRVCSLEEDLVVPARGDAHIVFDEFENNYQRHT